MSGINLAVAATQKKTDRATVVLFYVRTAELPMEFPLPKVNIGRHLFYLRQAGLLRCRDGIHTHPVLFRCFIETDKPCGNGRLDQELALIKVECSHVNEARQMARVCAMTCLSRWKAGNEIQAPMRYHSCHDTGRNRTAFGI